MKSRMQKELLILILLLIVLLVPIIYIGRYNVISADDYSYGYETHRVWMESSSVWNVLKAAAKTAAERYETWQGTYSSIFLMALNPLNFNTGFGWMIPTLIIGLLSASGGYFVTQLLIYLGLNASKKERGMIAIGIVLVYLIAFVPSIAVPVEGFFWFNGSVHYIFMHSFMLFFLGLFLKKEEISDANHVKVNKVTHVVALMIVGLIVGGGNYVSALQCLELSVILLFLCVLKRKVTFSRIIGLFSLMAGLVISVIAPGNAIRQSQSNGMEVVEAIINSFICSFKDILEWMNPLILCTLFMLIPFYIRLYKRVQIRFAYPAIVCVILYCLYASAYAPGLYGVGNVDAGRIRNLVQASFYFYLFLAEGYILGAIYNKRGKFFAQEKWKKLFSFLKKYSVIYLFFWIVLFAGVLCLTENRNTYSSVSAFRSIVKGEARTYYEESQARQIIIQGSEKNVYLEPLSVYPYVLYFSDFVTEDSDNRWINERAARYYGKESIQLIKE